MGKIGWMIAGAVVLLLLGWFGMRRVWSEDAEERDRRRSE